MTARKSHPAQRLADLLHEVRQARPDARDFALFDRRDALAELGVPHHLIDGFDAPDDAALDGHIAQAPAAAGGGGAVTAARTPDTQPFHLMPSQAYRECLGDAVGGDGTLFGELAASLGLGLAGAPIVVKPRAGLGGGGPSKTMSSLISTAVRKIPSLEGPPGPALKWLGGHVRR